MVSNEIAPESWKVESIRLTSSITSRPVPSPGRSANRYGAIDWGTTFSFINPTPRGGFLSEHIIDRRSSGQQAHGNQL